MYKPYHITYWLIGFLLWPVLAVAQQPVVKTTVSRTNILIGEQVQLKCVLQTPDGSNINWLSIPDSIPHFELVEAGKIDTVNADNSTTLTQTLTLTSFDSGSWATPSLPIRVRTMSGRDALYYTDSIAISVGYAADTTNQVRDIKPLMEVPGESDWQQYIWIGLGALALLVLLFFLIKVLRKKKPAAVMDKLSAYTMAIQELDKLQQLDLTDTAAIRQYHSGLSAVSKRYFGTLLGTPFVNKTTGDLLLGIKGNRLDGNQLAILAAALRCGDAVKFAKYLPAAEESRQCGADIRTTIESFNKAN